MSLPVRYSFANSKVISTFSRQSLWVAATSCFQSLSTSDPSVESRQSRAMQNTTTKKKWKLSGHSVFFCGREFKQRHTETLNRALAPDEFRGVNDVYDFSFLGIHYFPS